MSDPERSEGWIWVSADRLRDQPHRTRLHARRSCPALRRARLVTGLQLLEAGGPAGRPCRRCRSRP